MCCAATGIAPPGLLTQPTRRIDGRIHANALIDMVLGSVGNRRRRPAISMPPMTTGTQSFLNELSARAYRATSRPALRFR